MYKALEERIFEWTCFRESHRPNHDHKKIIFLCQAFFMASYFLEPLQRDTCLQTEAVVWMCSVKALLLEISQNSQENTCDRASFLINLQAEACNFIIKETLAQVVSCEFCEISKNTFFYRTPPVAASLVSTVRYLTESKN